MFKLKDYKDRVNFKGMEITPKKAIMAKCYDCCVYDRSEVKKCMNTHCPLWPLKEKWMKRAKKVNKDQE